MKKFVVFLIFVIIIVCGISYSYIVNKANYNNAKRENQQFKDYYEKEVYGADVATIINKAVDSNTKNNIEKDEKGFYIENQTNSIKIYIKMKDIEETYPMELIVNSGIEKFLEYYNKIQFKCTKIEYHKKNTQNVKSMLFEQITS